MPRNITTETIRSDSNPHTTYTVTLHDGAAVYCTCPHGRKWSRKTSCKHMRRAEKADDFRVAKRFIKEMESLSEEDFLAHFRAVAKAEGVDSAIDRVIRAYRDVPQDTPVIRTLKVSDTIPCPRCAGRGRIPCFSHVEGGICFQCKGACEVPAYDTHKEIDPEEEAEMEDFGVEMYEDTGAWWGGDEFAIW